jgi:hypothetical protein
VEGTSACQTCWPAYVERRYRTALVGASDARWSVISSASDNQFVPTDALLDIMLAATKPLARWTSTMSPRVAGTFRLAGSGPGPVSATGYSPVS